MSSSQIGSKWNQIRPVACTEDGKYCTPTNNPHVDVPFLSTLQDKMAKFTSSQNKKKMFTITKIQYYQVPFNRGSTRYPDTLHIPIPQTGGMVHEKTTTN